MPGAAFKIPAEELELFGNTVHQKDECDAFGRNSWPFDDVDSQRVGHFPAGSRSTSRMVVTISRILG